MKYFLSFILGICLPLASFGAVPYLQTPTNDPGVVGQQLFTDGITGYLYWGWGTNSQSSNATVVSASASIGVTTNGFNFSPFFSASSSNWVYSLLQGATNFTVGTSNGLMVQLIAATNQLGINNRLVPALPSDATKYLDGTGAFTVPAGGGGGGGGVSNAFNISQFSSNANFVSIKSGALITNSISTAGSGSDVRTLFSNQGPGFVVQGDGTVLWLDTLGNVNITYTNGATQVFMGRSVLVNGGVTGTEAGVPWNIGYLGAAGVVTNSPTGDLGGMTFAQLATILGVFGSTNSIFGGTFGTNAQTGQTTIDAQGNISHASTNQTFFALGREGTNGTPNLFKVDGTNGANGEVLAHGQGIMSVANALDYGADPTGATDSTAAIQRAIDSLGSIGGTCFIPRGTYGITGVNTIHMRRNVTLEGEMATYGGNGTQLSKTGSGATIMLAFTSCTIRNIHLVGQGVGNNQFGVITTNITDLSQSSTNFKLQDVKCEGFDAGFWIHNAWASEINTCYAQACRDGLLFSNVVDSIRVIGGEYYNCTNGIHLAGGNIYREPIECLFELDVVGLLIEDDVAIDSNYGITVQNCWFEGNPVNIDATDLVQMQIINNTLTANAGGTNIIFRGANRSSTISGNQIGGGCALHAVGSLVRGMLWENNYDSCTFPMVDSGTTGSIYVGANGLVGGNIVLKTGTYYGDGSGLTNVPGSGGVSLSQLQASTNSTTLASQGMATKVYADASSLNATNPSTGAGNIVRASAPTIDGATLTGTLTIPGTVNITNPVFINGIISTNIFSPTNSALGGAIIDFLYTETTTNAAGAIAYTGFSGFSPTNYNWKIIHILANGADRTVTFPTNTRLPVPPACVVTNGTQKDVLIQLQQGVFTNVTWYSTL